MKYNIKLINKKAVRVVYGLSCEEREKKWKEALAVHQEYEKLRHKFMAEEWCPVHGHTFLPGENECCMCRINKDKVASLYLKK